MKLFEQIEGWLSAIGAIHLYVCGTVYLDRPALHK